MSKFKAGDRVRITNTDSWIRKHGVVEGEIYTVDRIGSLGFPIISGGNILDVDDTNTISVIDDESKLEVVKEETMPDKPKFKVGDKVRIIKGYPTSFGREDESKGKECTIVRSYSREGAYGGGYSKYFYALSGIGREWDEDALELVSRKDKLKTELRIVYKIVGGRYSDPFESYSGSSVTTLQYEIGKKTKPPKGWNPLFAFDTLEHARAEHFRILKCVAKVRVNDQDFSFASLICVPEGTVLCDWVFPIEQVSL